MHTLERLPAFAAWASTHFGPMTPLAFATSHIPLPLALTASYRAARTSRSGRRGRGWTVLVVAAQIQFGLNAVLHLVTAVAFAEYCPACSLLPA